MRDIVGRIETAEVPVITFVSPAGAMAASAGTFIVMATEDEGTLTGYAIARVRGGEFGDERPVAMIDSIGVDPDRQHAGLGALLMEGIAGAMKKLGITELRTQVDWADHDLIRFFARCGFSVTQRLVLERRAEGYSI